MTSPTVLVVGAGISGLACARALRDAGATVRVVDRGRAPGGRMSGRRVDGRAIDLGASYFTAEPDSRFEAVVHDWLARGLAREWTDTFRTAGPDGIRDSRSGPMRFASPTGLRDLVIDLAEGLDVVAGETVEEVTPATGDTASVSVSFTGSTGAEGFDHVVLAMPDPQARRLLAPGSRALDVLHGADGWHPTIAVALTFAEHEWASDLHGAFVNDSPELSFVADDGDRRGDGAPVLVAHSSAELAHAHLDDPDGAIAPITEAVSRMLALTAAPVDAFAHRWTFARPAAPHDDPFLLDDRVGVCGDAWGGKASVAAAWTSGDALGRAIARASAFPG
ncbi:NAD(P)/FAD-dependent oxidoreductase [Marisediminicola sp. LYQ134]|uniref:NAD(P)/FAD-dependent oxidoreductase n=1 Tax=Marisediminicola sp. LYQ134 TaxID=3391061 RepID=UPI003982FCB4